ncbi:peptidylprolyl isomerase [Archangium gephyra]|uniref:Peptidyl-prolyl cis-trans isomerase n=1 Tax=Archangium gephyra TaxID=48 RepID=A0AAC8Q1A0_9BACT|nr:FKBP-type peptidyl-prolyl cis-trans isomerase [Archangium gephyra]AKI99088.1 FKBP-type peptidyl-prolyl cis-trans isomerase FkpA precursor [Archangium gephyra]REG30994.1 peptidylprolyl isomerase [Archangium gephyra]
MKRLLPLLSACLLLALSACDESTPESGDPAKVTYAPALGVDLAAMNRSESGLYTQDLTVGTGGTEVVIGRYLEVHYTGWLPNGTQFDTSRDTNQPFAFRFGYDRVIAGWEEGLLGMRAGGKRRLVIPSGLGYGASGSPPAIPPHSVLIFDVELLYAR